MPNLVLNFSHIDRSFEPTMQPDGAARGLLNVDTTWLDGRLRMGLAPAPTDVPNESAGVTVNNCIRVERPDGTFMMITSSDNGDIDIFTAVSGTGCAASVVTNELYADYFGSAALKQENFREDADDVDNIENQGGY